ncbi:MAG: acetate kinase [Myxococcaceae bacterium]|nr:acetate kinase [Myxococcaceae bacterium]
MAPGAIVLCLNGGSSSLKLALFQLGDSERMLGSGAVEGIGQASARLWLRDATGKQVAESSANLTDHAAAVQALFDALATQSWPVPSAVGHRLVHGGPDYAEPVRVDHALLEALRKLVPYAPLHLPAELAIVEAVSKRYPKLPQVVCFDTAFHRAMPELARRLPLPRELYDAGIRRYGFHGLSYEYIVHALAAEGQGRLVVAHLGSGASMAAIHNGQSLDTTMSFTPTGGIMMATRSGDLDPGVLLHLQRERGYDTARLTQLVEHDAGLRGVSGGTSDMETLLENRATDPHAAEAVALFCYLVKKQIGAYAAVLGGIDTLMFTGGIGEHAAFVRETACAGLAYLGIEINPPRNHANAPMISRTGGRCTVRVLATDEERMIARHTRELLFPHPI